MADEIDRECVTHSYACDCREAKTKEVIRKLVKAVEVQIEASGTCSGGCCTKAKTAIKEAKEFLGEK